MKKFISLLAIAVLVAGCGLAFAYDEGTEVNNKDQTAGSAANAPRIYRLVRYANNSTELGSTTQLSAGEVVVLDCVSDDGVTVGRAGVVASTDAVVGVVVSTVIQTSDSASTAANSVGSRNWGYIQVYGLNTKCMVYATEDATIAGGAVRASGKAGYAAGTGQAISRSEAGVFGVALDVVSADSNDNEVFIIRR